MNKDDVADWEFVAAYVATYPDGDTEGACDVAVEIGSVTGYTVSQLGLDGGEIYETHEAAQAEADRLNAAADEECGADVVGDAAASVGVCTAWFVRTRDDAGGSDEADDTEYDSEEAARAAAEAFAKRQDASTDADADAEAYLERTR